MYVPLQHLQLIKLLQLIQVGGHYYLMVNVFWLMHFP